MMNPLEKIPGLNFIHNIDSKKIQNIFIIHSCINIHKHSIKKLVKTFQLLQM